MRQESCLENSYAGLVQGAMCNKPIKFKYAVKFHFELFI